MTTNLFAQFVINGPPGQSGPGCLLILLCLFAPFLMFGIAARSLLSPEPLRGWAIAVMLLGSAGIAVVLAFMVSKGYHNVRSPWMLWLLAAIGALGTLPFVLLYEWNKRGWHFFR